VIGAPFGGNFLIKIGRRRLIFLSSIAQIVACSASASVYYINNGLIFAFVFGLARITQGFGSIFI